MSDYIGITLAGEPNSSLNKDANFSHSCVQK